MAMRLMAMSDLIRTVVALGDTLKVRHRSGTGSWEKGARYLGYGVMEAFASRSRGTVAGQLTRACLAAPLEFDVRMRLRECGLERRATAVGVRRVDCSGNALGSMGSKSRKGYGSLSLNSLVMDGEEKWQAPATMAELATAIRNLPRSCRPRRVA